MFHVTHYSLVNAARATSVPNYIYILSILLSCQRTSLCLNVLGRRFDTDVHHFQTIVRAEGDAATAVYAHKGLAGVVKVNGGYGTGLGAIATTDAQLLFHDDTPAFALSKSPGGAGFGAGGRIAHEARSCLKPRGQTA